MTEPLAEVIQLHHQYNDRVAVAGVNFTLARGDVLGLLGPNGAGKSTTLRIFTGNLTPSAGHVRIAGHNLLDEPLASKQHLGYLPDTPPLYYDFTVLEYLNFCGKIHRLKPSVLRPAIEETLSQCKLEDVRHRLIGKLSKGYQQRVGIAQAILHRPAIIVLDEPTIGLDPHQIIEVRHLIRNLSAHHAVVLSSHILSEIHACCNRALILYQGQQVWLGDLKALHAEPREFRLRFVGTTNPAQIATLGDFNTFHDAGDESYTVSFAEPSHQLPALLKNIVAADLGLRELAPQRSSLEQLFIDVTCGTENITSP